MIRSLTTVAVIVGFATTTLAAEPSAPKGLKGEGKLSDRYLYVVKDVLKCGQPKKGFWIDLGAGKGQVAIPLIEKTDNPVVMLDPDVEAMSEGLEIAREKGLENRLAAVVGVAENMPFPDNSVDLVVSRGSIFFWDDAVKGLREVYRVLRPGAKAYIGGGAGSGYPKWAADKLIRRRKEKMKGDEAEKWKKFVDLRRPEQMRKWAENAKLPEFQVMGKGAISAEDPRVGQGVWLLFEKKSEVVTKKEEDQVAVKVEGDTVVYSISSPSGIGGATISPWKGWPKQVIIRLHLRGLESFTVSNGKIKLSASVLKIKILDANGKPLQTLPDEDGYFEITLPKALLQENPKSLTLGWIDFYRQ